MLRRLLGNLGPSTARSTGGDGHQAGAGIKTRHLSCPRCWRVLVIPQAERFRCRCSMVFKVTEANKVQLCLSTRGGGIESNAQGSGLPRRLVEQMPVTTVDENDCAAAVADTDAGPKDNQCRICLSDYKVGDSVRVLPCFHRFHAAEIDDWLDRNTACPLCHLDVSEALTGTSGVPFITMLEGDPVQHAVQRRRRR